MVSIKAAARASILVSMMISTVFAEPGGRKLRDNPLSALDNHDLDELLDMELDEVFLVPKTMLQGGAATLPAGNNNNKHHHHNHKKNTNRQIRHLQADPQEGGSPSPSLAGTAAPTDGTADRGGIFFSPSPSEAAETGAPTDGTDRGLTSSFFSSYYYSPSAAPTAAPTVDTGSGSRGGLFGTESPTAAPSAADRDFDIEEDNNNNDNNDAVDREVAAAQTLSSGGTAGVAVVVVTTALLAMTAGVLS
eukprot:g10403.t1